MRTTIRIWDLPTRLFHWSLAACVVGAIASASVGGEAFAWHFRFGYAVIVLLLFRLAWGIVGPFNARFSAFPPDPAAALRQWRGLAPARAGHGPLGALSVYAMLLALTVQVGTGLFANDSIAWDGPLRHLVSNQTSDLLSRLHKINRFVVIALVVLHLAAIAWHAWVRGERIVRAMVTGDRVLDEVGSAATPSADGWRQRVGALAIVVLASVSVWALVAAAGSPD